MVSEYKNLRQLKRVIVMKKKSHKILNATPYCIEDNAASKTGIFAQRARVDQAIGLYYRKENLTFQYT